VTLEDFAVRRPNSFTFNRAKTNEEREMIRTAAILVGVATFSLTLGVVPCATANAAQDVLVTTESGQTRCDVGAGDVVCQYLPGFPQAPTDPAANCPPPPGTYLRCSSSIHWDIADVSPAGAFRWTEGNIPGAHPENDVVLNYGQSYDMQGWAILPSSDGTQFTNDRTGHGMFVSIDNVNSF
jgi:hypothetical protein